MSETYLDAVRQAERKRDWPLAVGLAHNADTEISQLQQEQDALRELGQELIDRYARRTPVSDRHSGCGWCGGLPHSKECLVGRFEAALATSQKGA